MTLAALPKPLRTQPDNTVKAARDIAEMAARAALQQLAVGEGNALTIAETAAEKDAKSFLMPMSCRRRQESRLGQQRPHRLPLPPVRPADLAELLPWTVPPEPRQSSAQPEPPVPVPEPPYPPQPSASPEPRQPHPSQRRDRRIPSPAPRSAAATDRP